MKPDRRAYAATATAPGPSRAPIRSYQLARRGRWRKTKSSVRGIICSPAGGYGYQRRRRGRRWCRIWFDRGPRIFWRNDLAAKARTTILRQDEVGECTHDANSGRSACVCAQRSQDATSRLEIVTWSLTVPGLELIAVTGPDCRVSWRGRHFDRAEPGYSTRPNR